MDRGRFQFPDSAALSNPKHLREFSLLYLTSHDIMNKIDIKVQRLKAVWMTFHNIDFILFNGKQSNSRESLCYWYIYNMGGSPRELSEELVT